MATESSVAFSLLPVAARRLEGKVALITGGASGIGEATARLFCRHGAKVVIADIQDDKGHSVCRDIGNEYASFVHCDVTSESDVRAAVDAVIDAHGKLDIMFNNAGVSSPPATSIVDTDTSLFERVMSINVTGAFLGTKHAARVMIPAGKGSIIVTGSVSSVVGGRGVCPYTSSKHAVVGLVKDAATELGKHQIRVNAVSPFLVATPLAVGMFGLGAAELEAVGQSHANLKGVVLKAEDVADAVLYLASEESRYVSGHNLLVDGGFTISPPN